MGGRADGGRDGARRPDRRRDRPAAACRRGASTPLVPATRARRTQPRATRSVRTCRSCRPPTARSRCPTPSSSAPRRSARWCSATPGPASRKIAPRASCCSPRSLGSWRRASASGPTSPPCGCSRSAGYGRSGRTRRACGSVWTARSSKHGASSPSRATTGRPTIRAARAVRTASAAARIPGRTGTGDAPSSVRSASSRASCGWRRRAGLSEAAFRAPHCHAFHAIYI